MQSLMLKFVKKTMPPWAFGTISTPGGPVYKVSHDWSRDDYWGMIKSRIGAFRMSYAVDPGLYAVGDPTKDSDVFVTANYKLTFDILRRELKGLNAWVLVLDTKSINVWCAAGKGTFGTDELAGRITATKLDATVTHRKVIVPQLGAVGVNAAEVRTRTGFSVVFGPVQAKDIPAYVRAGYKKTSGMRTVGFSMLDRLVLTPMELNPAMKKFPWFAAGVLLVCGLQPSGLLFKPALTGGLPLLALGLAAVVAGAFLTPVLLPFVPSRSFAVKGWIIGMLTSVIAIRIFGLVDGRNTVLLAASYIFFPAASSYLALQFTGSTTFTGMSGVNKELRIGLPVYIGAAGIASVLLVVMKLREWGVI